jgi:deoxyribodipyrimidine photo-lyase
MFCRDLRLFDNLGLTNFNNYLNENFRDSYKIFPIFILNPDQVKLNKKNENYFSNNAVQFMCESLIDLNKQLNGNLNIFYGDPIKVIDYIIKKFDIIGIGFQGDFSAHAKKRQENIKKICQKNKIDFFLEESDLSLISIDLLCKKNGEGFKKFGAFYKYMQTKKLDKIKLVNNLKINEFYKKKKSDNLLKYNFDTNKLKKLFKENKNLAQRGGRKEGLKKLGLITKKKFGDYQQMRNYLSYETSGISGYLNFGCISIREAYKRILKSLGKKSELLKQLFWRDFYLQAVIYLPGGNKFDYMDDRYNKIKWKNNKKDWKKIIESKTGFLLVDAAMNQMKITGFMHNRARMIVGVFWTKYCLIDSFHPKYGSQVGYSKYLLDAIGISQNKMNHQWITEFDYPGKKYAPKGIGMAGRPMDISNKNIKKFDPKGEYIKKWLPEFKNVDLKKLINWDKKSFQQTNIHFPPMFDDPKKKYKEWIQACKVK